MIRNFFLEHLMKSAAVIGLASLFAQPGRASQATDKLTVFKRYFGTIEARSNGVGTKSTGKLFQNPLNPSDPRNGKYLATATIQVSPPPNAPNAIPFAAYLYWITVEKTAKPSSAVAYLDDPDSSLLQPPNPDPRTFKSNPVLQYPATILGKPLGNNNAPACWAGGGATGSNNGATTARAYRLDAYRYLETDPSTHQKVPLLKVQLPDSGGSTVPLTEGLSLVVLFRDPLLPFRVVVM